MSNGKVIGRQALTGVTFRRPYQHDIEIEFVIDTGFEGALALPKEAVTALGLPFFHEINANLADDSSVRTDVHEATIIWHGLELSVAVLAMGRRPLLGTALLDKKRLTVDFEDNGVVIISPLSAKEQISAKEQKIKH